jgi:hypothetical protein
MIGKSSIPVMVDIESRLIKSEYKSKSGMNQTRSAVAGTRATHYRGTVLGTVLIAPPRRTVLVPVIGHDAGTYDTSTCHRIHTYHLLLEGSAAAAGASI